MATALKYGLSHLFGKYNKIHHHPLWPCEMVLGVRVVVIMLLHWHSERDT